MASYPHPRKGTTLKEGESIYYFTAFSGAQTQKWARRPASNPWRCMELELNGPKNLEARAFLSQARDFYSAAERAGPTARPLLLYYSFLNLAKMLIKARNPDIDLTRASHGVIEDSNNRSAQRFRLTSQSVRVARVQNRAHILDAFTKAVGSCSLNPGHKYEVCALLAQIPSVHRVYCHVRRQPERLYRVEHAEFRFLQSTRELWSVLWVKSARRTSV
jgi:YaaC-like protein